MGDFSILDAMSNPQIWGGWFKDPSTWAPWRAFLGAMFGLPLSDDDLELFKQCTGRAAPPEGGYLEAWLVVGRRGGKSMILALIAVYLAIFRDWSPYLSPGEVGSIRIIATDRRQARVIYRYCRALLTKVPAFRRLIEKATDDEIALTNGITIEIQTASFRSVRGHTIIAALADEIAFWHSEESSANPDSEIIAALRPAMATIPNAFFLCASSPYARRGELWNAFRRWHGRDDAPALVWHATTRTMNPTVPQAVVDEALERDPAKAGAEFLAEFRKDVETFVSPEVVEAAVVLGRFELPYQRGVQYAFFTDPSGAVADSATIAVTHRDESGNVIVDAIRERRPPFSPEQVTGEFAGLIKAYNGVEVHGDHYGGEWPREQFRKSGIRYVVADKPKSILYNEFLPLLNSGKVELLDNPRLVAQLCGLERTTARSGKDSINHAPGGHDDIINAVAGSAVIAATQSARPDWGAVLKNPRLYQRSPSLPPAYGARSRGGYTGVIGSPHSVSYSDLAERYGYKPK
jgi:hypothetical protein